MNESLIKILYLFSLLFLASHAFSQEFPKPLGVLATDSHAVNTKAINTAVAALRAKGISVLIYVEEQPFGLSEEEGFLRLDVAGNYYKPGGLKQLDQKEIVVLYGIVPQGSNDARAVFRFGDRLQFVADMNEGYAMPQIYSEMSTLFHEGRHTEALMIFIFRVADIVDLCLPEGVDCSYDFSREFQ